METCSPLDFFKFYIVGGAKVDIRNSRWLELGGGETGILHGCAKLLLVWETFVSKFPLEEVFFSLVCLKKSYAGNALNFIAVFIRDCRK
jgi:hypothetical protein